MNLRDLDNLDVEALDRAAVSGRFGATSEFLLASAPWYAANGVDPKLVLDQKLHPIGEYLPERRAQGFDLEVSARPEDAYEPIVLAESAASWLQWGCHPGDSAVIDLIDSRLTAGESFRQPESAEAARLEAGLSVLREHCPSLAADVANHIHRVAMTDSRTFVGMTWTDLLGLITFGNGTTDNPQSCAESLLHEGLHSKCERLTRGFAQTFVNEDSDEENVPILWRRTDGEVTRWTIGRSFDACYVYSHLSIFYLAMFKQSRNRPLRDRLQRVAFRAEYLSRQVHEYGGSIVGVDRMNLLDWLDSIRIPAFDLSEEGRRVLTIAR